MSDKTPPQNQSQVKDKSAAHLAWVLVAVGTAYIVAERLGKDFEEGLLKEAEISQQVGVLKNTLRGIELDANVLDSYIALAKQGDANAAGCDIADLVLESSTSDQAVASLKREKLADIKYITDAEYITYRNQEQRAYSRVTIKVGELKAICQSLFPVVNTNAEENDYSEDAIVANAIPEDKPPLPSGQKEEITLDNNR